MALQDLKKLHSQLEDRIKKDAGKFRTYYANRQTHAISINNKDIIEQSLIEMTDREGYRSETEFKACLLYTSPSPRDS